MQTGSRELAKSERTGSRTAVQKKAGMKTSVQSDTTVVVAASEVRAVGLSIHIPSFNWDVPCGGV